MRVVFLLGLLGLSIGANPDQITTAPFQIAPAIMRYILRPSGPPEMQARPTASPQLETAASQADLLNTLNAPLMKPAPQSKPDIQYDPHEAIKAQQMGQLVSGAAACEHDAVAAQLTMGNRNRASILQFAESTCGGALVNFIMAQKRPEKEARAFVHLQASQELDWYLAANR
jgi:hypothetical protein